MDDPKRCEKCIYWLDVHGNKAKFNCFCHHLLHTGKRRISVDGVCHSRCTDKSKKTKRRFNPFTME